MYKSSLYSANSTFECIFVLEIMFLMHREVCNLLQFNYFMIYYHRLEGLPPPPDPHPDYWPDALQLKGVMIHYILQYPKQESSSIYIWHSIEFGDPERVGQSRSN